MVVARQPYAVTLAEWVTLQDADRLAAYGREAEAIQQGLRVNWAMHEPRRLMEERMDLEARVRRESDPVPLVARVAEITQLARVMRRRRKRRRVR